MSTLNAIALIVLCFAGLFALAVCAVWLLEWLGYAIRWAWRIWRDDRKP